MKMNDGWSSQWNNYLFVSGSNTRIRQEQEKMSETDDRKVKFQDQIEIEQCEEIEDEEEKEIIFYQFPEYCIQWDG